jgi:hypothetical protein
MPKITKTILKNMSKVRRVTLTDFNTYYNAMVIKSMYYSIKKIDPHMHGKLVSNEDAKVILHGKHYLFTTRSGTTCYLHRKTNETQPLLCHQELP